MSEYALQNRIVEMLQSGSAEWQKIRILNSTSPDVATVADLIGSIEFDEPRIEKPFKTRDTSLSVHTFGSQKPDIALVSKISGQIRVLIEVKLATKSTHKELDASQFVRNLLYLLAATEPRPRDKTDIRRAVLVAAPDAWFENTTKSHHWTHLVQQYGGLAKAFQITLGEIRTDQL